MHNEPSPPAFGGPGRQLRALSCAGVALWLGLAVAPTHAQVPELILEKLPGDVNTDEYDEISPVVSRDGRRLYFTRSGSPDFDRTLLFNGADAKDSLDAAGYERLLRNVYAQIGDASAGELHANRFNQDVYVAELGPGGEYESLSHPGPPLNNALPNAIAAAMPESGHFMLLNQFPRRGGLATGFSHAYRRGDGTWTWPEPVHIEEYYTYGEGVGLTVSDDGEYMVLSLQRSDGAGSNDLYYSQRLDSTRWSAPVSLGADVNTQFREATPSLSEDKRTLYFSSNREGRGGNDIYFCRRLDDSWTNWSRARRFLPPLTSESDDSQPYFNEATGYLYFASKRDGSSDIYRVRLQEPRPIDVLVVGTVRNARTGEVMDADVRVRGIASGFDTLMVTKNGKFDYRVETIGDLVVSADKEGYLGHVERVDIRRDMLSVELDVWLDPAVKGGNITLDPIFFEQSLPIVKTASMSQLDRLRGVLARYPNIYVRIEGHTDNQGPQAALEKLSRQRAETIRDYLVERGIESYRVQATGFGARKPVSDNESDQGRTSNRRVEVVITRILPAATASSQ